MMSTRDEELRRLAQAVAGWSNCNKAWLDTSEDVAAAVVGHIDEDGNTYPVVTVDCELYYSGDSLALAKFYASANPAAVLALLDEIERLRAEIEAMRKQVAPSAPEGWQPIETAPKDGTHVLLANKSGTRVADGMYGNYKVWSWPYVLVEPAYWRPMPAAPGAQENNDG